MTVLGIIIAVFTYLVIGRIFVNILITFKVFSKENNIELFLIHLLYPIYILFKIVNFIGNTLTKALFERNKEDI